MKKRCVIHANCQGEALLELLSAHRGFATAYEPRLFVNYTGAPVPPEELAAADALLYQHLGQEWGQTASETLLARLRPKASALCIPNMFFMGYWPLWMSLEGFDFGDRLLEELVGRRLSRQQAYYLAVHTRTALAMGLDALVDASLEREAAKEKRTSIKYLDDVLARWRHERLFWTINHPRLPLLRRTADAVLDFLGLPPLTDAEAASIPEPFAEFALPIHPLAAEHLGLACCGPDGWKAERHHVYGRGMTFAEYVGHYLDCRMRGEHDFIGYLRLQALAAAG